MMHMIIFGILDLPWWGYIVATLIMTQITILGVTVFLHRTQAHRAVELHSSVSLVVDDHRYGDQTVDGDSS